MTAKLEFAHGVFQDVLYSNSLEQRLKTIQESFNRTQRVAGVGSWNYDTIKNEFSGTSEFFRIFELEPSKSDVSLFKGALKKVHPEDRKKFINSIENLAAGNPLNVEYRIKLNDGSIKYIIGKGEPVFDEDKKVINLLGTVQDITEYRIMENELEKANRILSQAQALTHTGSWEMDLKNNMIFWSEETYQIFGVARNEFSNTYERFLDFIHPEDRDIIENILANPKNGRFTLEFRIIRPDGSVRDVYEIIEYLFDQQGKPLYIYGTIQDITEKKALEKELERRQQEINRMAKRFQVLIRESTDVFEILSPDGTITYMSEASERVIGYKPEERVGRKIYEYYRGNELLKIKQMIKKVLEKPYKKVQDEVIFRKKNGKKIHLEVNMQNLLQEPSVEGIVINFRDITKRVKIERKMYHITTHDDVTGLPNRLYFTEQLNIINQQAKAENFKFAIIMMDIDGFKYINDVLGYQLGDQLMVHISKSLQACCASKSIICRYTSDQFAIILQRLGSIGELDDLIQKIMSLFEDTFRVDKYGLDIAVNMGISVCQGEEPDADTIIKQTEMALFWARSEGKNQYKYFSRDINIRNYKHFELRNDLRFSVEKNQLKVYFQPMVNLQTSEIIAVEALIRWEHPYWGMVPPDEFISLAEETGYIINIGRWMLREVCSLYRQWLDKGLTKIKVSINISCIQLFENYFVENIIDTIKEYGLDPHFLILEITESILMDNGEKAISFIKRLKSFGIQIALDDFGTGYSSLSYLNSLNIDILKIDGSFIRKSISDEASEIITRAIINMAWELKIKVVAEGIENWQQLKYLQKINCYAGQGYLFSQPMPVDCLECILADKFCRPINHKHKKNETRIERRKHVRVNLPILWEADLSIKELKGMRTSIGNTKVLIKNIGQGGLCFITDLWLPVHKEVVLLFEADLSGIKFSVLGHPVWSNNLDSGLFEYGVEFLQEENQSINVMDFVEQIRNTISQDCLNQII